MPYDTLYSGGHTLTEPASFPSPDDWFIGREQACGSGVPPPCVIWNGILRVLNFSDYCNYYYSVLIIFIYFV